MSAAVEPWALGVTVSVWVVPQLSNVTEPGLTVATEGLLELTDADIGCLPVRLQPSLPSPPVTMTLSCVEPLAPPTWREP